MSDIEPITIDTMNRLPPEERCLAVKKYHTWLKEYRKNEKKRLSQRSSFIITKIFSRRLLKRSKRMSKDFNVEFIYDVDYRGVISFSPFGMDILTEDDI